MTDLVKKLKAFEKLHEGVSGQQLAIAGKSGHNPNLEGTESIAFHSLFGVCNGGHISNARGSGYTGALNAATEEELIAVMKYQSKAIIIVENEDQSNLVQLLEKLSGDYDPKYPQRLRAKRLALWSSSADLWMVRQGDNTPWTR